MAPGRVTFKQIAWAIVKLDTRLAAPRERKRIQELLDDIPDLTESQRMRIFGRHMAAWRRDQYCSTAPYARLSRRVFYVGVILAVAASLYIEAAGETSLPGWSNYIFIPIFAFSALAGANALWAAGRETRTHFSSSGARRSDLLLTRLLFLTAFFYRSKDSWHNASVARHLRRRIHLFAREIRDNRVLLRRTDLDEWRIRRQIKENNLRVSKLLESHADALALAGSQSEYMAICRSLRDGLVAASEDDLNSILENAPTVTVGSRIARIATRVAPAAILLAAAIVLPLFPQFHGQRASIYGALFPMAILTVIGAPSAVVDSIKGAITQSLGK